MFVQPYLWANVPFPATTPGVIIQVLDVGVAPSFWVSDGTNWRPLNGRVLLYQRTGTLAAPLATLTGVTLALFTLPQTLTIQAGVIPPNGMVCVTAEVQRTTATAAANAKIWLGNLGTTADVAIGNLIMGATANLIIPRLHGSFFMTGSSGSGTVNGAVVPENTTSASAILQDATVNTPNTLPLYVTIGMSGANAADTFNLNNYSVWLEA